MDASRCRHALQAIEQDHGRLRPTAMRRGASISTCCCHGDLTLETPELSLPASAPA
jgi:hypothetical protein